MQNKKIRNSKIIRNPTFSSHIKVRKPFPRDPSLLAPSNLQLHASDHRRWLLECLEQFEGIAVLPMPAHGDGEGDGEAAVTRADDDAMIEDDSIQSFEGHTGARRVRAGGGGGGAP